MFESKDEALARSYAEMQEEEDEERAWEARRAGPHRVAVTGTGLGSGVVLCACGWSRFWGRGRSESDALDAHSAHAHFAREGER